MQTILVVDNNHDSLNSVVRTLNREKKDDGEKKYNVLSAESLKKALEIVSQVKKPPSLAVVDLRLEHENDPEDLSGLDLIAEPAFPAKIPVIILSANKALVPLQRILNTSSGGRIKYLFKREAGTALVPMIESALVARNSPWRWVAWSLLVLSALPFVFMVRGLWDRAFVQGVISNLLVNVMWFTSAWLLKLTRNRF